MSNIISAIFILFCLCMHYSSTALRLRLPAASDYKAFEEHHGSAIKVAEHEKVKVVADTPNWKGGLKALKKKMEINGEEEEGEMNSGDIPTKSDLVSLLSSGDHAVLYADYSRPRTRPPSHN